MSNRKDLIAYWAAAFDDRKLDSPLLSAQVLLARVLGLERIDMLLDSTQNVSVDDEGRYRELACRRLSGEPVAYLLGEKEFYGLNFYVGPGVLIPRPETEMVVDWMRNHYSNTAELRVFDIGTGSGILAVTIASYFKCAHVVGVDISMTALVYAQKNTLAHGLEDRVSLCCGSLSACLDVTQADVLVANLPYVPESMRSSMSHEVLGFEPHGALFAGTDGFDLYRKWAEALGNVVRRGTVVLCEIDATQRDGFEQVFSSASSVRVEKDLAGLDRLGVVVF